MNVIEVHDIVKTYDGRVAVDGVSFDVEEGEIFAILGPNGAGKTTTVESIAGLRTPDSGAITVLGLDPQRDHAALRQQVGVQLQESQLPDQLRVREALDLYASFYETPADWHALIDDLGLGDHAGQGLRQALRRSEAAAVDRARARREPADRGARRADHRPGPAGPARHLGPDRGHPRPGRDRRPRHPLHGRGRAAGRPARRSSTPARSSPSTRPPGSSGRSTPSSGCGSGRPHRSTTTC